MKMLVILSLLASLAVAAPAGAAEEVIVNQTPPTVTGEAVYLQTLTATGDTWTPPDVTKTYKWLRDGSPVATSASYRLGLADVGHRFSVSVTASKAGLTDVTAVSAETATVQKAVFDVRGKPAFTGVRRFERTVVATMGEWSPKPTTVRFQWLRNGKPIKAAHRKRYHLRVADVGARVAVRVTARREGYRIGVLASKAARIKHRVDVRHTVTYSVTTRGHITVSLGEFKRLAQQTYDDPRGWRGSGVEFKQVKSGGSFRLVLSQAALLPSFGYPCDSYFSCRVGNFVIINQDRWLGATPVWHASKRSLRDYRNLVVNHETGHWLGHRHSYCPGPGRLAPVMMQQSKGLHGCRANPWPVPSERGTPRF
jgi:hypothetical protein